MTLCRDATIALALSLASLPAPELRAGFLKLGAVPGNEWQAEIIPGMTERYKLVKLGLDEVFNGKGVVAVIEVHSSVGRSSGAKIENVEEIKLVRGIGPLRRQSWRIEQGERKQNWKELFFPPKQ